MKRTLQTLIACLALLPVGCIMNRTSRSGAFDIRVHSVGGKADHYTLDADFRCEATESWRDRRSWHDSHLPDVTAVLGAGPTTETVALEQDRSKVFTSSLEVFVTNGQKTARFTVEVKWDDHLDSTTGVVGLE
jgi:hypothetical protein